MAMLSKTTSRTLRMLGAIGNNRSCFRLISQSCCHSPLQLNPQNTKYVNSHHRQPQHRFSSSSSSNPPSKNQIDIPEWKPTEKISRKLLDDMNQKIIGHDDLKQAIIMALLCREHVYTEGPPGVGKTMLAEVSAAATSLDFYFYQMHRDTRLQEIIGDSVIFRETDESGGEIIRQENRPGGIITAQLCVLDDISRAPGEALNILLRILNERKFGDDKIPLLSAIATANPSSDEYYTEPLDPANLDRFTFQIESVGIIQQQNWGKAAQVIDLFADLTSATPSSDDENSSSNRIPYAELETAFDHIQSIPITENAKMGLLLFLHVLGTQHGLDASNSMLSDRTFLVKALKVMRTYAFTHGQDECDTSCLRGLRFLTTFRIPPHIHALVPTIVEDIVSGTISIDKGGLDQIAKEKSQATAPVVDNFNLERGQKNQQQSAPRESASELFSLDKVPTSGMSKARDDLITVFHERRWFR